MPTRLPDPYVFVKWRIDADVLALLRHTHGSNLNAAVREILRAAVTPQRTGHTPQA